MVSTSAVLVILHSALLPLYPTHSSYPCTWHRCSLQPLALTSFCSSKQITSVPAWIFHPQQKLCCNFWSPSTLGRNQPYCDSQIFRVEPHPCCSNSLPSPSHKLNARGLIKTSHCSFFTFIIQGSAVRCLTWTIKAMRKEIFILFYF